MTCQFSIKLSILLLLLPLTLIHAAQEQQSTSLPWSKCHSVITNWEKSFKLTVPQVLKEIMFKYQYERCQKLKPNPMEELRKTYPSSRLVGFGVLDNQLAFLMNKYDITCFGQEAHPAMMTTIKYPDSLRDRLHLLVYSALRKEQMCLHFQDSKLYTAKFCPKTKTWHNEQNIDCSILKRIRVHQHGDYIIGVTPWSTVYLWSYDNNQAKYHEIPKIFVPAYSSAPYVSRYVLNDKHNIIYFLALEVYNKAFPAEKIGYLRTNGDQGLLGDQETNKGHYHSIATASDRLFLGYSAPNGNNYIQVLDISNVQDAPHLLFTTPLGSHGPINELTASPQGTYLLYSSEGVTHLCEVNEDELVRIKTFSKKSGGLGGEVWLSILGTLYLFYDNAFFKINP